MKIIADATPVGTVAGISDAVPVAITVDRAHTLQDGDRVRVIGPDKGRREAYVSCSQDCSLSLYADARLKQPSQREGLVVGARVVKLVPEDWAVIIALNYYLDKALKPLQGPQRDADLFEQWVKDSACVPDSQVIRIKSSEQEILAANDCVPTVEAAQKVFSKLLDDAILQPEYRLGRRLYVFCSGHGMSPGFAERPDYREAPLLTAEAAVNNGWNHVATRGYAEAFRAFGIFDEVILFADCCRDTQLNMSVFLPRLPLLRRQREAGRGFYAMGAEQGAKAWEQLVGHPPEMRGVFSYVLMQALTDPAIRNDAGHLTGTMLSKFLHSSVPGFSNQQAPSVEYDPGIEETIILKRANYVQPVAVIRFGTQHIGKVSKLYGGSDMSNPLQTTTVGEDGLWRVPVDVSLLYKVAVEAASKMFETVGSVTHVSVD